MGQWSIRQGLPGLNTMRELGHLHGAVTMPGTLAQASGSQEKFQIFMVSEKEMLQSVNSPKGTEMQ